MRSILYVRNVLKWFHVFISRPHRGNIDIPANKTPTEFSLCGMSRE